MSRVLIVSEGGGARGYGHVIRCHALAESLRKRGADVTMLIDLEGDSQIKVLPSHAFQSCAWLRHGVDDLPRYDSVIVDSYHAPLEFYQHVSRSVKLPIFVDDFTRLSYPPGVVINPRIDASPDLYPEHARQCLVGNRYVVVRAEFSELDVVGVRESIDAVLIVIGGTDPGGYGPHIAHHIRTLHPQLQVHLVWGVQQQFDRSVPNPDPLICNHVALSAAAIKNLMSKCDVAIVAAGQTVHELAAIGLPAIIFAVAENQRSNLRAWGQTGTFVAIEEAPEADSFYAHISAALKTLESPSMRSERGQRARSIVDGRGAARISDFVWAHIKRRELRVRLALLEDCDAIYQIASDPVTRASSFAPGSFSLASHREWYRALLEKRSTVLFVADIAGIVCGHLGFDIEPEDVGVRLAVVSIGLLPELRGLKVGEDLLESGVTEVQARYPECVRLVAHIRAANQGSVNFFERVGFSFHRQSVVDGVARVEYHRAIRAEKYE